MTQRESINLNNEDDLNEKVVAIFRKYGFDRHEDIPEAEVRKVFDQRSEITMAKKFDPDLFKELMDECLNRFELSPSTIGDVVEQAYNRLTLRLKQLKGPNGMIIDRKIVITEKRKDLQILLQSPNKRDKTQELNDEVNQLQNELKSLENDYHVFKQELFILEMAFNSYKFEVKQKVPKMPEQPKVIKVTALFYLTTFAIFAQSFVIASSIRPSFLPLMYYTQVYYLLFIGYYIRRAGWVLLAHNIVSIIGDIIYFVFCYAVKIEDPFDHTMSLNIEKWLIILCQSMLVLTMLLRLLSLIQIWALRRISSSKMIFFLCGQQFLIKKRVTKNIYRHFSHFSLEKAKDSEQMSEQ